MNHTRNAGTPIIIAIFATAFLGALVYLISTLIPDIQVPKKDTAKTQIQTTINISADKYGNAPSDRSKNHSVFPQRLPTGLRQD